jgi:hypothetical protein
MGVSLGELETTLELASTFFEMVLYSGNLVLWVSNPPAIPDLGIFPCCHNNWDCLGGIFCLLLGIR